MSTLLRSLCMLLQPKRFLHWRQTSPTTFERNIDALESFHVASGSQNVPQGRRRLDLTTTVKLQSDKGSRPTARQARDAWISLRQKHPAMASVIKGSTRVYHKTDQHERQVWLDETFVTIRGHDRLTSELLNHFKATSRPTLYFLEEKNMFFLRTPHYSMDGLGAFCLLSDYMTELGQVITNKKNVHFNEQLTDLAACLEVAVQPMFPSQRQLLRLWKIRRDWLKSYPSIGIKQDKPGISSVSSWKDLKFSSSETQDLIIRAKQNDLSLTHAVHAALVIGAKQHGNYPELSNYTNVIVLNLRGRAADKSSYARNIASAHHAIWPFTLPVTDNFTSVAREMKRIYTGAVGDPDLLSLAGPIFVEGMRMMPTSSRLFHSSPFVSSCGKLDSIIAPCYGPFHVEDVSIVAETCQEDIVVIVWSYKGKLMIRAHYNEGTYSTSNIERYLQLTNQALRKGLAILS